MRNFLHSLSLGIALIGFVSCGMNQEQVEQLMTENKI